MGHRDITAGTLGAVATDGSDHYLLSNAHVLHPHPFSPKSPYNLGVWQPGPYDTGYDYGNESAYKVAEYATHARIRSVYDYSDCPITRTLNWLYRRLGRNSFIVTQVPNYVDAGAARLLPNQSFEETTYAVKYGDADGSLLEKPFFGLVFAGSSYGHGVICKFVKYMPQYFRDLRLVFPRKTVEDVAVGAKVAKDGRTSGFTTGTVLDNAASIVVSYGIDVAWFEDVVLTDTSLGVRGGDSGSPVWIMG